MLPQHAPTTVTREQLYEQVWNTSIRQLPKTSPLPPPDTTFARRPPVASIPDDPSLINRGRDTHAYRIAVTCVACRSPDARRLRTGKGRR